MADVCQADCPAVSHGLTKSIKAAGEEDQVRNGTGFTTERFAFWHIPGLFAPLTLQSPF